MRSNDMNLSLEGDTFTALKTDFEKIMESTVGNMIEKGAEDATVTIKIGVSLDKMRIDEIGAPRDIIKPTFKHDINSVMQVKEKMAGQLSGNYELVFDDFEHKYIMRTFSDGQINIFEGEFNEEEEDEESNVRPPIAESKQSPFEWLMEYEGQELYVTEAMGNYAARSENNVIVLSSATDKANPFYCDAEILKPHVGHTLMVEVYGEGNSVIDVVCTDEETTVFSLKKEDSKE